MIGVNNNFACILELLQPYSPLNLIVRKVIINAWKLQSGFSSSSTKQNIRKDLFKNYVIMLFAAIYYNYY